MSIKKAENAIEALLEERTIRYGRATVPASIDDKLRVKWHLPGCKVTTGERHALMIARRINLLMGGSENGMR